MNYPESEKILKEIKKANNILVNCHVNPDPDSVGSALALKEVLTDMGKVAEVVCVSGPPEETEFLKGVKEIRRVDFRELDFNKYDLFIIPDSGSWSRVVFEEDILKPEIPLIVIDHHVSNKGFGKVNLIDSSISSTCEILYKIFKDWKVDIKISTATSLMTGVISDTGSFKFPATTADTFEIAMDLMKLGANKEKIMFNLYQNENINSIRVWAKILEKMKVEKESKFVWTALSFEEYDAMDRPAGAKDSAATHFGGIVNDTDFGIIMLEKVKGELGISFRGRTDFDTTKIAAELGGGGHPAASGARVKLPYKKAVEKVLETAKKYAKKSK